jgi:hypothetical protein
VRAASAAQFVRLAPIGQGLVRQTGHNLGYLLGCAELSARSGDVLLIDAGPSVTLMP